MKSKSVLSTFLASCLAAMSMPSVNAQDLNVLEVKLPASFESNGEGVYQVVQPQAHVVIDRLPEPVSDLEPERSVAVLPTMGSSLQSLNMRQGTWLTVGVTDADEDLFEELAFNGTAIVQGSNPEPLDLQKVTALSTTTSLDLSKMSMTMGSQPNEPVCADCVEFFDGSKIVIPYEGRFDKKSLLDVGNRKVKVHDLKILVINTTNTTAEDRRQLMARDDAMIFNPEAQIEGVENIHIDYMANESDYAALPDEDVLAHIQLIKTPSSEDASTSEKPTVSDDHHVETGSGATTIVPPTDSSSDVTGGALDESSTSVKPVTPPMSHPEKPVEKPADKITDKPADTSTDKPAVKPEDKPAGTPVDKSTSTTEETPSHSSNTSTGSATDKPTGSTGEKPSASTPTHEPSHESTHKPEYTVPHSKRVLSSQESFLKELYKQQFLNQPLNSIETRVKKDVSMHYINPVLDIFKGFTVLSFDRAEDLYTLTKQVERLRIEEAEKKKLEKLKEQASSESSNQDATKKDDTKQDEKKEKKELLIPVNIAIDHGVRHDEIFASGWDEKVPTQSNLTLVTIGTNLQWDDKHLITVTGSIGKQRLEGERTVDVHRIKSTYTMFGAQLKTQLNESVFYKLFTSLGWVSETDQWLSFNDDWQQTPDQKYWLVGVGGSLGHQWHQDHFITQNSIQMSLWGKRTKRNINQYREDESFSYQQKPFGVMSVGVHNQSSFVNFTFQKHALDVFAQADAAMDIPLAQKRFKAMNDKGCMTWTEHVPTQLRLQLGAGLTYRYEDMSISIQATGYRTNHHTRGYNAMLTTGMVI